MSHARQYLESWILIKEEMVRYASKQVVCTQFADEANLSLNQAKQEMLGFYEQNFEALDAMFVTVTKTAQGLQVELVKDSNLKDDDNYLEVQIHALARHGRLNEGDFLPPTNKGLPPLQTAVDTSHIQLLLSQMAQEEREKQAALQSGQADKRKSDAIEEEKKGQTFSKTNKTTAASKQSQIQNSVTNTNCEPINEEEIAPVAPMKKTQIKILKNQNSRTQQETNIAAAVEMPLQVVEQQILCDQQIIGDQNQPIIENEKAQTTSNEEAFKAAQQKPPTKSAPKKNGNLMNFFKPK